MARKITIDCISCGACESECPNEAITEGENQYVIDPKLCTECVGFFKEPACQAVCPVECIQSDPDNKETEEQLAKKALSIHADDAELKKKIQSGDFPSHFRGK